MEVEIRLTVVDLIWGCRWPASLFFEGAVGKYVRAISVQQRKPKQETKLEKWTSGKERSESEYFE